MRLNIFRPLVALGTAAAMLGFGSAVPASAQTAPPKSAPPPVYIHVHITDNGFDQTSYGPVAGPASGDPTVEFDNDGTVVHTATATPGQGGTGEAVTLQWFDSAGNLVKQVFNGELAHGPISMIGAQPLDTGGIAPGGKAIVAFVPNSGAPNNTYAFTSATDCLNGNTSGTFNCTPSTVVVKSGPIPAEWNGSVFDYAGADDCVIGTVQAPPGGTARCQATGRKWQTVEGSFAKPASGTVNINIDDVKGYQPTVIVAEMGTTFVFKNVGLSHHTVDSMVSCAIGPALCAWWGPFIGDGVDLAPGDTYTWATPPSEPAAANTGGPPAPLFLQFLGSQNQSDKLYGNAAGNPGVLGYGVCLRILAPSACGQPGMTGDITLLAPKS